MEITNMLLIDLGADPKVYSAEEKLLMGSFADRIKNGELHSILSECALPEEKLEEQTRINSRARDALLENMRKTAALGAELADKFSKNDGSFFADSDKDKEQLLLSGFSYLQTLTELRKDTLNAVLCIYDGMNELIELQNIYNITLARLGMINIASMAAETEGTAHDEDAIMPVILDAYDKLTDLTALTNDVKDKAVIIQHATEDTLCRALDSLAFALDLMGDRAKLDRSKVVGSALEVKRIADEVIHTYA